MPRLQAEGKLLRVFVAEGDRSGGRPAYEALVAALQAAGFPGATVFKGIEGFGARRVLRSSRVVEYSTELPVVVEIVESEANILAFMPTLRSIVRSGLVTLEHLRLVTLAKDDLA